MPQQLDAAGFAAKIRQAHPGAYDDLDDDALTQRVLAKYPQYKDMVMPNVGLAPPASMPTPAELLPEQQHGGSLKEQVLSTGQDVMQAAKQGRLSELMRQQAYPIAQSAENVGAAMTLPVGSATKVGLRGVGRVGRLASDIVDPDITGIFSPRLAHVQRAAGKVGRLAEKLGSEAPKPPVAEQVARPPRPDLVEQMGGKPVEDLANSDAAVKERMEESPEFTYSKYAKAHQGKGSRSYPEPDYFQEQGPNRAPWGGNFPHQ